MKRILFFLSAIILVSLLLHSCGKEEEFDESLLIGKWKETGSAPYHYRYDEKHSGVRWKPSEDVLESEGEEFTWELEKSELMRLHIRKIDGGVVPENFTVTELTATSLRYKNETKSYSFTKIE